VKKKFEMPSCSNCDHRSKSIFSQLKPEEIESLDDSKGCNVFKKGQIVFQEGNRLSGIFCIFKGKLKMYKTGPEGKEQIIRFAKEGDIIGYRAALSDEPLSVSAATLEETSACFIPKRVLFEALASNQKFSFKMMEMACHEIGEANKIITNLAQKSVRERLAEVLLILQTTFGEDEDGNLDVKLTREEISSVVGTATESVIRLLSEFKKDQLIELNGKKIHILEHRKLAEIGNVYD